MPLDISKSLSYFLFNEYKIDFNIVLTEEALVSEYITRNNETTLIIAAPYTEHLFTASGDYDIVEMIVANSSEQISVATPEQISLGSAYPNPFNPSTTLRLYMPLEANINVSVYNIMGQQVDVIHDGLLSSGYTNLTWNAGNFPSGMYIVKVVACENVAVQKVMLMK